MEACFQFGVPVDYAADYLRALPPAQLNGMQPLLMIVSTPVFVETEYLPRNTK